MALGQQRFHEKPFIVVRHFSNPSKVSWFQEPFSSWFLEPGFVVFGTRLRGFWNREISNFDYKSMP
jgi:hypothetical protein